MEGLWDLHHIPAGWHGCQCVVGVVHAGRSITGQGEHKHEGWRDGIEQLVEKICTIPLGILGLVVVPVM